MTKGADEIARLFRATPDRGANFSEEVFPGYPGLVVAEGGARSMTWGFPLAMKGKQGQSLKPRPVNNTRTDKLDSGFWRPSFIARRCLIPVSAFAEAEGMKGKMTRTWFSVPGEPVFACAGIWRETAEWGSVYSMVMTEACVHIVPVHDRMPVILRADQHDQWLSGTVDEAMDICRPYEGLVAMEGTVQPWVAKRPTPVE